MSLTVPIIAFVIMLGLLVAMTGFGVARIEVELMAELRGRGVVCPGVRRIGRERLQHHRLQRGALLACQTVGRAGARRDRDDDRRRQFPPEQHPYRKFSRTVPT